MFSLLKMGDSNMGRWQIYWPAETHAGRQAGRWSGAQTHGEKQASSTLYRDTDVWDHGGFSQIRQTGDPVRTLLFQTEMENCARMHFWCDADGI